MKRLFRILPRVRRRKGSGNGGVMIRNTDCRACDWNSAAVKVDLDKNEGFLLVTKTKL